MTAWHQGTPADRAMTPDAVAAEIMNGVKGREWVIRTVPAECRWKGPRTRPPLFREQRTRSWWEGRKST